MPTPLIPYAVLLASIAAAALAPPAVLAQEETESKRVARSHVSASAGPNFTSLGVDVDEIRELGEELEDVSYRDVVVGFYLGVSTGVSLGPLSLRTGLTFVNGGALFDGSTFLDRDEFAVNFITIPIDVRLALPISERVQPYVSGGPEFRFRLDLSDADPDFEEDLRRLTPTASIGAGIRIELPVVGVGVSPELRYSVDFVGLTTGEVTVREEAIRIKEAFEADMLRVGLSIDL